MAAGAGETTGRRTRGSAPETRRGRTPPRLCSPGRGRQRPRPLPGAARFGHRSAGMGSSRGLLPPGALRACADSDRGGFAESGASPNRPCPRRSTHTFASGPLGRCLSGMRLSGLLSGLGRKVGRRGFGQSPGPRDARTQCRLPPGRGGTYLCRDLERHLHRCPKPTHLQKTSTTRLADLVG